MTEQVWRATIHSPVPRVIAIRDGTTRLGASSECDVVLADPLVDDVHVSLICTNGDLSVIDGGSREGSIVDGLPLRKGVPRIVLDGSTLRVGKTLIEVRRKIVFGSASGSASEFALALIRDAQSPSIVVVEGLDVCSRTHLASRLHIGRSTKSDLVLHDPSVSLEHVEIQVTSDGCVQVRDCGSKHGTLLGEDKLPANTWRVWDRSKALGVGDTVLTLAGVAAAPTIEVQSAISPVSAAPVPPISVMSAPLAQAPALDGATPPWRKWQLPQVPWPIVIVGTLSFLVLVAITMLVWIMSQTD